MMLSRAGEAPELPHGGMRMQSEVPRAWDAGLAGGTLRWRWLFSRLHYQFPPLYSYWLRHLDADLVLV